jgi:all-trans-retinol 13,14-reductase
MDKPWDAVVVGSGIGGLAVLKDAFPREADGIDRYFVAVDRAVFARELGRTIAAAGGEIRTCAEVTGISVQGRRVTGVRLRGGERIDARCVISDVGAHNTMRLLPSGEVDYGWAQDITELETSTGYVGLYLGLAGDIARAGADAANTWIYESWDVNKAWDDPVRQSRAPALFVAFPSLRDAGYAAFKDLLTRGLLAQFNEHFPALAPMVQLVEASTPITVAIYTGAEHGAMYRLATTPRRFLSPSLRPRTPIGDLLLAGQDACTPGVTGAMMGGLMAAASLEPQLWRLLR